MQKRREQLEQCKEELVRQTAYARAAIELFEKTNPESKLDGKQQELRKMPREHFDRRKGV